MEKKNEKIKKNHVCINESNGNLRTQQKNFTWHTAEERIRELVDKLIATRFKKTKKGKKHTQENTEENIKGIQGTVTKPNVLLPAFPVEKTEWGKRHQYSDLLNCKTQAKSKCKYHHT